MKSALQSIKQKIGFQMEAKAKIITDYLSGNDYEETKYDYEIIDPEDEKYYNPNQYLDNNTINIILQGRLIPKLSTAAISVTNQDCLKAAKQLKAQTSNASVVVLNMANETSMGGGFFVGARAQEEDILRHTDLSLHLVNYEKKSQENGEDFTIRQGRVLYKNNLPALYTPNVRIVCNNNTGSSQTTQFIPVNEQTTISIISAAAVIFGYNVNNLRYIKNMIERIYDVLFLAQSQEEKHLVLGAWGCGAFKGDPTIIARIFAYLLNQPEFKNAFTTICFAVLAKPVKTNTRIQLDRNQRNLQVFTKLLDDRYRQLPKSSLNVNTRRVVNATANNSRNPIHQQTNINNTHSRNINSNTNRQATLAKPSLTNTDIRISENERKIETGSPLTRPPLNETSAHKAVNETVNNSVEIKINSNTSRQTNVPSTKQSTYPKSLLWVGVPLLLLIGTGVGLVRFLLPIRFFWPSLWIGLTLLILGLMITYYLSKPNQESVQPFNEVLLNQNLAITSLDHGFRQQSSVIHHTAVVQHQDSDHYTTDHSASKTH